MRRPEHALLAVLVAAAALLRFAGLDQGVRRGSPTPDEWENFVGPVAQMWEFRTPNPHVHGGYPGLFNWLVFLPMGLGGRVGGEAGACVAARAVVAAFGTLNVLLLYLVVRRSWGAAAALLGAALLAFSRSEVSEAHFITPDVLVVSAFLALLLTAGARPGSPWTGAWAGIATALKYSGVLLFAAVAGEMAAQRRFKRLLYAGACAAFAFVAAAPFALQWRSGQRRGISEFASYYFGPLLAGRLLDTVPRQLAEVGGWIWINLGPPAVVLMALSLAARPRRPLAGPVAVMAASLAVLSVAGQVYPRHVLLASAAATVVAAAGFGALRERLPRWGAAVLAVATVAVAFSRAVAVARGYARPAELDRAAEWIEAQRASLRVATSLERLRLEGPVELRARVPLWDWPAEPLAHYDLVVAPRDVAGRLSGLEVVQAFEAPGNPGGAILVLRAIRRVEPPWPAPLTSRGSAPGGERAWDGDPATAWTAPAGPGWLEAEWERPRPLHAVELTVPEGAGYWPQRLRLHARRSDGAWALVEGTSIRPARAALQQPPHGQIVVLGDPIEADALRVERRDGRDWGIAEMRVLSPPAETPPATPR